MYAKIQRWIKWVEGVRTILPTGVYRARLSLFTEDVFIIFGRHFVKLAVLKERGTFRRPRPPPPPAHGDQRFSDYKVLDYWRAKNMRILIA